MPGDLPCLVCGHASVLWLTRAERTVRRCGHCGLLWVPEGLATVDGVSIYEQDAPVFFEDGRDAYYLDDSNLVNFEEKYHWVARTSPSGELLDVGAAFGHFAAVAQRHRPVTAIELGPAAVQWAREHLAVDVRVGSIYGNHPEFVGRFAAITLWDVIEHVPDPEGALRVARSWLQPGGRLFLSSPDAGSLAARVLGRRWHYVDPVQHLVLFGRHNLGVLLARAGFRVTDVRSFGRLYNTAYVGDKMATLGRNNVAWRAAALGLRAIRGVLPSHLRVNAGDVMGIAAERVPDATDGR